MSDKLNHRMTAQDAGFLYFERPHAPLHIGSLGVYEGQIPYERFVEHIQSRIPQIPRYRQRVMSVPFALAHPTWEDDPDFHADRHIFQHDIPAPGTDDQLREFSVELFKQPLDRSKPLWEMHIINGLEGDRSAILSKVHHCMVDGVSGIELLLTVVDITTEPTPPPEAEPYDPHPLPSPTHQITDALVDNFGQQREILHEVTNSVLHPGPGIRRATDIVRSFADAAPWMSRPAPRMPFTTRLTGDREAVFNEMSFPEIREIRSSLGGTVNDVVLAVLTGALHDYLPTRGYDVSGEEPRIAIPVNIRLEDEEGALGNRVSAMLTPLPIAENDPARRLEEVRTRMDHLKAENQAGVTESFMRWSSYAPAAWHAISGALPTFNTVVNMICTNVPGPMIPLYSVGHLLLAHYPLVPLSFDMGLGLGVTSYNHKLYFGLMADPHAVPDLDRLREFVDESYLALRSAAGVEPSDVPAIPPRSTNGVPADAKMPVTQPAG